MNANENQIVVYQPDDTTRLSVRFDGETVWLSQEQMIDLFQRDRSVISRHIANAFKEGEVDKDNCLHILQTNAKGRPEVVYNLEVVTSVGYRVKSLRGVMFRRWATRVLKEYLLRGYSVNARMNQLEDKVDRRFAQHEQAIVDLKEKVDFFVQTNFAHRVRVSSSMCEIPGLADRTGFLRVGDTSLKSPKEASELTVNCAELKAA